MWKEATIWPPTSYLGFSQHEWIEFKARGQSLSREGKTWSLFTQKLRGQTMLRLKGRHFHCGRLYLLRETKGFTQFHCNCPIRAHFALWLVPTSTTFVLLGSTLLKWSHGQCYVHPFYGTWCCLLSMSCSCSQFWRVWLCTSPWPFHNVDFMAKVDHLTTREAFCTQLHMCSCVCNKVESIHTPKCGCGRQNGKWHFRNVGKINTDIFRNRLLHHFFQYPTKFLQASTSSLSLWETPPVMHSFMMRQWTDISLLKSNKYNTHVVKDWL